MVRDLPSGLLEWCEIRLQDCWSGARSAFRATAVVRDPPSGLQLEWCAQMPFSRQLQIAICGGTGGAFLIKFLTALATPIKVTQRNMLKEW